MVRALLEALFVVLDTPTLLSLGKMELAIALSEIRGGLANIMMPRIELGGDHRSGVRAGIVVVLAVQAWFRSKKRCD